MDAPPVPTPSVAIPGPRADPLRRMWGPVTLRCVWELLVVGIRARPTQVREVREHALALLPADAALAEAEAIASQAARDWVARSGGTYAPCTRDPDLDILPSPAWREAIWDPADTVHDAVFRLHFADGLPLEDVQERTRIDGVLLRGAREAVREMARQVVEADGVSVGGWDPARLDRLIARIATAAGDQCPGPGGLATEVGKSHADRCPRCSRALRILREGLLSPSDLFPPEEGPCLSAGPLDMLAIQVQASARTHLRLLSSLAGAAGLRVAPDVLLVNLGLAPTFPATLAELAERGAPAAGDVRAVRRPVTGTWGRKVITGGDVLTLLDVLGRLPWGETQGIPSLPVPAPPPPSAMRWWSGALLVGALALAAGVMVFHPGRPAAEVSLEAEATSTGVVFDTDEHAFVAVLGVRGDRKSVV